MSHKEMMSCQEGGLLLLWKHTEIFHSGCEGAVRAPARKQLLLLGSDHELGVSGQYADKAGL